MCIDPDVFCHATHLECLATEKHVTICLLLSQQSGATPGPSLWTAVLLKLAQLAAPAAGLCCMIYVAVTLHICAEN